MLLPIIHPRSHVVARTPKFLSAAEIQTIMGFLDEWQDEATFISLGNCKFGIVTIYKIISAIMRCSSGALCRGCFCANLQLLFIFAVL